MTIVLHVRIHNKQIRSWVVTDKLHNEFVLCAMALVWLTPLKNGPPHMDYNLPCQIWSPLSHGMHVTRKNWVLASQLSGSLKVIWTNTDRSGTYSFLLLFHVNLGLSCTFSKILAKKLQIFSTHGYLMPRPRGSHLNLVMPHMLKNRKMVLPVQGKRKIWWYLKLLWYNTRLWWMDRYMTAASTTVTHSVTW